MNWKSHDPSSVYHIWNLTDWLQYLRGIVWCWNFCFKFEWFFFYLFHINAPGKGLNPLLLVLCARYSHHLHVTKVDKMIQTSLKSIHWMKLEITVTSFDKSLTPTHLREGNIIIIIICTSRLILVVILTLFQTWPSGLLQMCLFTWHPSWHFKLNSEDKNID